MGVTRLGDRGAIQVGCARKDPSAATIPLGESPQSFGSRFGTGCPAFEAPVLEVGDVISCAYDQSDFPCSLRYWINGKPAGKNVREILVRPEGRLWLCIWLEDSSIQVALEESSFSCFEACGLRQS